jgi:RNA polymerase sigma-70 factor, ECF subfamily
MAPAEEAYARYGRALARKAERILKSRSEAEDMVQALFTDLLDRTERLDLPWLYRALTHRCLTYLRDTRNRERLLERNDAALAPMRSRAEDRTIDTDLLLKLTRVLDEPTLEILVCRFYDDMTQDEIAGAVGLSRKTVGRKLDDIRSALAQLTEAT